MLLNIIARCPPMEQTLRWRLPRASLSPLLPSPSTPAARVRRSRAPLSRSSHPSLSSSPSLRPFRPWSPGLLPPSQCRVVVDEGVQAVPGAPVRPRLPPLDVVDVLASAVADGGVRGPERRRLVCPRAVEGGVILDSSELLLWLWFATPRRSATSSTAMIEKRIRIC